MRHNHKEYKLSRDCFSAKKSQRRKVSRSLRKETVIRSGLMSNAVHSVPCIIPAKTGILINVYRYLKHFGNSAGRILTAESHRVSAESHRVFLCGIQI